MSRDLERIRSCWVSRVAQIVAAFLCREGVEQFANLLAQISDGSLRGLAQQGFQLGEDLLDRVQIGRVWRQIDTCRTRCLDDRANRDQLVGGQVVHHHDIAGRQRRNQAFVELNLKDFAVHRAVDDERRGDRVDPQASHECQGLAVTMRDAANHACTTLTTPTLAHHCGVGAGFVNKTSLAGSDPGCALRHDVRASATSARSCSAACSIFLKADLTAGKEPPDRCMANDNGPVVVQDASGSPLVSDQAVRQSGPATIPHDRSA